jgi:glucosyl-3-phosphoglycerate synthase
MWRALSVLSGDVILYLDADSTTIQRHYVLAMCAPVLSGEAQMVKGHYRRRLGNDPDGGGRVNHLLARPLLRAHFPELSWVKQPLAGETALDRQTALSLPFSCGYAVEIGMLIDASRAGYTLAQADLHEHEHRHRSLHALASMADEVVATVLQRAGLRSDGPKARSSMESYEPACVAS